jgi:hypothetical protein
LLALACSWMSMKIAKRVSKSLPWGLNKSSHEIEPLGHISDCRTRWHRVVGPFDTESDARSKPLERCHASRLNQSDCCCTMAHCHELIAPSDPRLGLTVELHIGRVWRGLERSREQQIGRTLVRRPPSDPRVSPTLPRVTLCAPRQTPHLRNSALDLSDASFQLVRRLSKTTPRGSRGVGLSLNPGRRTQAGPMLS